MKRKASLEGKGFRRSVWSRSPTAEGRKQREGRASARCWQLRGSPAALGSQAGALCPVWPPGAAVLCLPLHPYLLLVDMSLGKWGRLMEILQRGSAASGPKGLFRLHLLSGSRPDFSAHSTLPSVSFPPLRVCMLDF